ncbi:MAG TPA: glutamate--tRNA ligase family protein [Methylomirabilota bacterium]|nr:glutamate--tRNA ligase family protein [Methylomirabilota bacterium]
MSVRVRFAPSPTGYLHIGGARTALFNWLYARHTGGVFVLRIEDTDDARNTQEAVEVIFQGLRWLGLEWDEGPLSADPSGPSKGPHGPYFQSRRKDIYLKRIEELLSKDLAYRSEGAIKFRMPREPIIIPDVIIGDVRRELTDREALDPDFVIVRSDGQPVFHLVNVIDDLEMGITHVIRGEDHLANTAKHLALFKAFGAEAPKYAHIPLILNNDGTKMGKRDKGASLHSYVDEGFAPEAVVNYLYLLGWSPKDNREILAREEVVQMFDLPQILRHNARFDFQKLHWMNGEYLRSMPVDRFVELAKEGLKKSGVDVAGYTPEYTKAALATVQGKAKQFNEVASFADFYFTENLQYDPEAAESLFKPEAKKPLAELRNLYAAIEPFEAAALEKGLKDKAKELGIKPALLIHPLRLSMTGKTIGPSLYHLVEVLGRERTLKRLDAALQRIQ